MPCEFLVRRSEGDKTWRGVDVLQMNLLLKRVSGFA